MKLYIPAREPETSRAIDRIGDMAAALLIVAGGCWAVALATFL
ncbi:hypothetical protein [Bosea sp. (in: a-proteobacteria)]|nr:hypothetical protein [Bosea sp. (in: a-proteobacteria)]